MKGQIICFEGIDGAGKRTQAALLKEALNKSGKKAKVYSYPDYSSEYGKVIHQYLHGNLKLGRKEHFLLFLMDIMKDRKAIKTDLSKGTVVIMDRYFYTALAYICPSGLDYKLAKRVVGLMNFIPPSTVFYLDLPTKLTSVRKAKQKVGLDKFEKDQKFLKQVKKIYGKMFAERYVCRKWVRIDATKPIDVVHKESLKILLSKP